MARRDWREAADRFGAIGWGYDRALMLSLLDDEEALAEAIGIARCSARPRSTRRVDGAHARARPARAARAAETTRANPAGLTARQLEVLA